MSSSNSKPDFRGVIAAHTESEKEEAMRLLLERMGLWEKICQLTGAANLLDLLIMPVRYNHRAYPSGENKRLKIPPLLFTDGPRGVGIGCSTCFPAAIARGATWNIELEQRVAEAIGLEARAQGSNFFAGVCINIPRHPGWGRTQETFSEASYLLGKMAVADVAGLQRHVMACVKHFACNSMEDARFTVDVVISDKTLHEVYLPHFKKAIEAGAASIMSAYNKVNGEYCGHHKELLLEILRDRWGFEGLVMSDFVFGVRSPEAIQFGLDVEMPFAIQFARRLYFKVKRKQLDEAHIDRCVRNVLKTKARFYHLIQKPRPSPATVACQTHRDLARESSRKSLVLLKNEAAVLPLRHERQKIAVLGPLAQTPNLGDRGSSRVRPPYVATVMDGMREHASEDVEILGYAGKSLSTACAFASQAEVSVLVVGLDWRNEGEYLPVLEMGGDREDLALPDSQIQMIEQVAQASKRCVVVLMAGSAVLLEPWLSQVDALIMAWYPGMEGGRAIADVLWGDYSPEGFLPLTFPNNNDQLPPFDKQAKAIEYGPYHGYRWFEAQGHTPSFPLGFGLSYTDFTYGTVTWRRSGAGGVQVSLTVTNVGDRAGVALILVLRARCEDKTRIEPAQLCDFARVNLRSQEAQTLTFEVRPPQTYEPEQKAFKVHTGGFEIRIGPNTAQTETIRLDRV